MVEQPNIRLITLNAGTASQHIAVEYQGVRYESGVDKPSNINCVNCDTPVTQAAVATWLSNFRAMPKWPTCSISCAQTWEQQIGVRYVKVQLDSRSKILAGLAHDLHNNGGKKLCRTDIVRALHSTAKALEDLVDRL